MKRKTYASLFQACTQTWQDFRDLASLGCLLRRQLPKVHFHDVCQNISKLFLYLHFSASRKVKVAFGEKTLQNGIIVGQRTADAIQRCRVGAVARLQNGLLLQRRLFVLGLSVPSNALISCR